MEWHPHAGSNHDDEVEAPGKPRPAIARTDMRLARFTQATRSTKDLSGDLPEPRGEEEDIYFKGRDAEPCVTLRRGIVVSNTTTDTARGRQALDLVVEDERAADVGSR